jgi:hypothetical protein
MNEYIRGTVTNIEAENAEGTRYKATVRGQTWSGIHEGLQDWEVLHEAIAAGEPVKPYPVPSKEDILADIITMIDLRTHQIITGGFQWQGKTLSSSEAAQANFLAVEQARQRGEITFEQPLPWFTKDDEPLLITTAEEWCDLLNAKDTHIFFTAKQGGHALKTSAKAMTVEQLKAWSDPR